MKTGRIRRISIELDDEILDLSKKNGLRFIDASREIAKATKGIKSNNKILKEIRW